MKKLFKIISISLALLFFAVSSHAAKVSADAPAMSKIVKSGQLVLGTSGNQPPMTMLDKNGKPEGFDIDLADLMAQALGVKLVTKQMEFSKLLDALESGEVDAVFHAGEPRGFIEGHPQIARLFSDVRSTERFLLQGLR